MTQAILDVKGVNLVSSRRMQQVAPGDPTLEENSENASAVPIINKLWQKETFLYAQVQGVEVSSGATTRWKAVVLIKTKDFGDIEVDSVSTKSRIAKQMAAFQAVPKLNDLLIPEIHTMKAHAKQQMYIKTIRPQARRRRSFSERD